jgi:hypothetical protein
VSEERQQARRSERAETDAAARIEERSRELAEQATRGLIRLLARTREEIEDLWAEARDRREQR